MLKFLKNVFQLKNEAEEELLDLERIKIELEEELKRLDELESQIKAARERNKRH